MFLFGNLKLNKVGLYKEAELDLDYRGLTVIRGHNKNALTKRKRTNGAGKSLLLSTIPNLVFSSHPTLSQVGKRSSGMKGSLVREKGSSISMEIYRSEGELVVPYTVIKHKEKHSVGYRVLRDGKDLKLTTATKAEKYLNKLFPFSEEQFYTHTYLDAGRPFLLQYGSPAQRQQFCSDLWDMDGYDYVKDACAAMKKELRDDGIRLDEMRRQLSDLSAEVDSVDYKDLKTQLSVAQSRATKLKKKSDALYDQHAELRLLADNKDTIKLVRKKVSGNISEANLRLAIRATKKKLSSIEDSLDRLYLWGRYVEESAAYKIKHKELRESLGEDSRTAEEIKSSIKDIDRKAQKLRDKISAAKSPLEDARRKTTKGAQEGIDKGAERKAQKLMARTKASSLESLLETLQSDSTIAGAKLSASQRILKMASDLSDGGNCMVCGSDVEHTHENGIVENLRSHVGKRKAALKKVNLSINTVELAIDSLRIRAKRKAAKKDVAKYTARITKAQNKLDALPSMDALRDHLSTLKALNSLTKPEWKGDEPKGNSAKLRKKRSRLQKFIATLGAFMPVADMVGEFEPKYRGKNVGKLSAHHSKKYRKVQCDLSETVAEVARLEPVLRLWKKNKEALGKLQDKVRIKEKKLKDVPVLEMLGELYSAKGLKTQRMQEYAHHVETMMNQRADLIFHEKFRFNFDVGPNKFDIIATSGSGKKTTDREVRTLSGSERRAFSMLLMTSVRFMLPSAQRTNLLVLDEMDAGLDDEGRGIFIDTFLPELGKIIPHIIVITPLKDEYPGSRSFVATKEGTETKLIPVQEH